MIKRPEAKNLIAKFKFKDTFNLKNHEATQCALICIETILKLPVFWIERDAAKWAQESQFGKEGTEEYWIDLKKEIEKTIK